MIKIGNSVICLIVKLYEPSLSVSDFYSFMHLTLDTPAQASRKLIEFTIDIMSMDLLLDDRYTTSLKGLENRSALVDTMATLHEDIEEFRVSFRP